MKNGWIRLHRKIMYWQWWKHKPTRDLFLYLLLMASHEKQEVNGIKIEAGQCLLSVQTIAEDLKITPQNVRTILKHLTDTKEITLTSTNRYSIITLINWLIYNPESDADPVEPAAEAPVKKDVKDIRKKVKGTLEERRKQFIATLLKYQTDHPDKYPRLLYREFTLYWTEFNPDKTKMRFEDNMYKYFDVGRRLSTFYSRDKDKYSKATQDEIMQGPSIADTLKKHNENT